MNPGPQYLSVDENAKWDEMLDKTRSSVAELRRIKSFEAITDVEERRRLTLNWLKEHVDDLGYGIRDEKSWDGLQDQLFDWVIQHSGIEDAWRVV